jgi:Ran-binding protein 1
MADENPEVGGDSADEPKVVVEEDSTAHFEPLVKLEPIKVVTGEEDEDVAYKERARLYRFDPSTQEWKERGIGDVKFLVHKVTGQARILLRQEKTLKLCLNHMVNPDMELKPNMGSDRAWTWSSMDYADPDDVKVTTFAIKFKNSDVANEFKSQYDKFRGVNKNRVGGAPSAPSESKSEDDPWLRVLSERMFKPLSEDFLRTLWAKYDADKSNFIEHKELSKLFTDLFDSVAQFLKVQPPAAEQQRLLATIPRCVERAMEKLDTNSDKKLSWEEFIHLDAVQKIRL